MLLNLIASCLFACAVGVGSTSNDSPYLNAKKYASYDDNAYTITLSADELNNYTWDNFTTYVNSLSYGTNLGTINYDTYTNKSLSCWSSTTYKKLSGTLYEQSGSSTTSYKVCFSAESNSNAYYAKWYYEVSASSNTYSELEHDLTIVCTSTRYDAIKQAIELDIQANSEPDYSQFATDAIDLLVGSIGGIATGIGTGLSSLISYLAISGTSMSPFMAVIFVLGGIALAFGLSRWVVNLLTSLGQRNR